MKGKIVRDKHTKNCDANGQISTIFTDGGGIDIPAKGP